MAEQYREIPIAIALSIDTAKYENLMTSLKNLNAELQKKGVDFSKVTRGVEEFKSGIDLSKEAAGTSKDLVKITKNTEGFSKTVRFTGDEAEKFFEKLSAGRTKTLTPLEEKLQTLTERQKMWRATIGWTGRNLLVFSRQVFWLSLGMMFATFSMTRQIRTARALRQEQKNLAEAIRTLREVESEASRMRIEYGRSSLVVKSSSEELRIAQESVAEAETRLTEALMLRNLAEVGYWLGLIPTIMRFGTELFILTTRQFTATTLSTGARVGEAVATTKQNVQLGIQNALLSAQIALRRMLVPLMITTVITAGVLAVTWIAQAEAQRRAQEEAKRLAREIKDLSSEYRNIPLRTGHSVEILTRHGWVHFPPEITPEDVRSITSATREIGTQFTPLSNRILQVGESLSYTRTEVGYFKNVVSSATEETREMGTAILYSLFCLLYTSPSPRD